MSNNFLLTICKGGKIGDFSLNRQLYSGLSSEIWLAKNAKNLPVALKFPSYHLFQTPENIHLFHNEARILSRLDHPNIIKFYESFKVQDIIFMTLEYHKTSTLALLMSQQVTIKDPKKALLFRYVFANILRAFEYLHEAFDEPIYHGDLAPSNILLTSNGEVKLIDFALANFHGRFNETHQESPRGSFAYFSPERAKCEKTSHLSELYSLGIIAWELLTGKKFIEAKDRTKILKIAENPEYISAKSVKPDIDEELSDWVDKLIAINPEKRFQSAKEARQALQDKSHDEQQAKAELIELVPQIMK